MNFSPKQNDALSRLFTNLTTASIIGFVVGVFGHSELNDIELALLAATALVCGSVSHYLSR